MKEILGEKCYTRQEVAAMLGVSHAFVIKSTVGGRIKSSKIGRSTYITETSLRDYLNGNSQKK